MIEAAGTVVVMCGRVVATSSPEKLSGYLGVTEVLDVLVGEDHNLAPMGRLPIVWAKTQIPRGRSGSPRVLGTARWGLVPGWARTSKIGEKMYNARAETIGKKPAFRSAYERRRCLIPVDGFYEWGPVLGDRTKQPWYIYRKTGDPLVLAGLWESWVPPDSYKEDLITCTVITVPANRDLQPLHGRMPAILHPETWSGWLDPEKAGGAGLDVMLRSAPEDFLSRHPVDSRVNNARNKGSGLLEEVTGRRDSLLPKQEQLW